MEHRQEHCPCCGRFPSEDDGFYMFIADAPDFVSLFCDKRCAEKYEAANGQYSHLEATQ